MDVLVKKALPYGRATAFLAWFIGTLWIGTFGQWGYVDAGLGQGAVEFLPPMGDVAGGPVYVKHG
jgi:hypothetical protein